MEEIIFRGKVIDNSVCEIFEVGEFVYGDLIHYPNGETFIRQQETGMELPVNPNTVGQYTGLKDKNGQCIFEDDIIQFTRQQGYTSTRKNSLRVVKFFTHAFCGFGYSEHEPLTEKKAKECIVIGNIYDNPELLKKINNN